MDGIRLRGMISHLLDARYLIWWFDISDVSLYGLTGDAAGGSIMTMINALSLSLSLSLCAGCKPFLSQRKIWGHFDRTGYVVRAGVWNRTVAFFWLEMDDMIFGGEGISHFSREHDGYALNSPRLNWISGCGRGPSLLPTYPASDSTSIALYGTDRFAGAGDISFEYYYV